MRGGAPEGLEGDWDPSRVVVLEFPDRAAARRWIESDAYAPLRASGRRRRRAPRARRRLRRLEREHRQQRLELDLGLGQLGGRVAVAHDADARVAARDRAVEQRAAQRDAELAVLGRVRPAHGARVPAAVEPLERRDERCGGRVRLAADGRRRVQQPGQLDGADRAGELCADRRGQVLDVRDARDDRLVARRSPRRCGAPARARSGA